MNRHAANNISKKTDKKEFIHSVAGAVKNHVVSMFDELNDWLYLTV